MDTVDVQIADIRNLLPSYGPLQFIRVEWRSRTFALLRYEFNGVEAPLGLRMDLDKKAIMDSPDEGHVQFDEFDRYAIWDVVVEAIHDADAVRKIDREAVLRNLLQQAIDIIDGD